MTRSSPAEAFAWGARPSRRMQVLLRLPFWIVVLLTGWALVRPVLG